MEKITGTKRYGKDILSFHLLKKKLFSMSKGEKIMLACPEGTITLEIKKIEMEGKNERSS